MPDPEGLAAALRPELLKIFKPAFLGRVTVVPYFPLSDEIIRRIVVLQLERIRRRVADTYKARFTWEDDLVETIAARCRETESGARNVEQILARGLLPELSAHCLEAMSVNQPIQSVHVAGDASGGFSYRIV